MTATGPRASVGRFNFWTLVQGLLPALWAMFLLISGRKKLTTLDDRVVKNVRRIKGIWHRRHAYRSSGSCDCVKIGDSEPAYLDYPDPTT